MEAKEQNLFQQFFRNEVTWLGMIIATVWAFVTTVVLPLQKLQIQVAQVQVQLKAVDVLTAQVQEISTKQQVDESELLGLLRK